MDTITAEERVRQIRAAFALGDRPSADHHFLALVQASGKSTERWLRRVIALTPAIQNASAYYVSADLRQELAMHLWQHITASDPEWERTYWRALLFAQHHVATRYMREAGYWVAPAALAQGFQAVAALSIEPERMEDLPGPDVLGPVELAGDIRSGVMALPPRERAAVVLRYWRGWREGDIAQALGCTDRTVRGLLHRAQARLGPIAGIE